MSARVRLVSGIAVVALSIVAGCSAGSGANGPVAAVGTATGTFHGTAIQHPYPLPHALFRDTAGQPFNLAADASSPITLVFFGYSHCPDVCNVVLANVAAALRRSDPAVRSKVRLLFISTDPDRDTPSTLRGYLDRFDPTYVGLRAPETTMEATMAALHIAYAGKETAAGGGYEVSHGTQITAFQGGTARVVWMAETSVHDLRADLARLARAPS
jgi:protein SCO1/2